MSTDRPEVGWEESDSEGSEKNILEKTSEKLKNILLSPPRKESTPRENRYKRRHDQIMAEDLAKALTQLSLAITKMGNKPSITVHPFTGKLDKRSFVGFIREFNKMATAYGWSKREMCSNISIYLKSEASAAYDEIRTKNNWEELLDELSKRLGVGDSVHSYRRQIQNRKQFKDESFHEFAQALSDLSDKASRCPRI